MKCQHIHNLVSAFVYAFLCAVLGLLLASCAEQGDVRTTPEIRKAWKAMDKDDVAGLARLLDAGLSVNARCIHKPSQKPYISLLGYAFLGNAPNSVMFLIQKGVDIYVLGSEEDLPLAWCVHIRDENAREHIASKLLDLGADINATNRSSGSTALMSAISTQHIDYAKFLVDNGADVDVRGSKGKTLLMMAADRGGIPGIELVLRHVPHQVNLTDALGRNALYYAINSFFNALQKVQLLIEAGENVYHVDAQNETLLFEATRMGDFKMIEFLLQNGVDASVTNNEGKTVLDYAEQIRLPQIKEAFNNHAKYMEPNNAP